MSAIDDSRAAYANGYYGKKLEEGLEFQDIMTHALYQRGIVIVGHVSRRFQNQCGENMLGAEIKRDGKFRTTGNLYIEIEEKSHPDRPAYVASGIHRADNSWLFVIGDEGTAWIFSTKYLRLLQGRYEAKETPTSRGFLLPVAEADKYCLSRIDIVTEAGPPA